MAKGTDTPDAPLEAVSAHPGRVCVDCGGTGPFSQRSNGKRLVMNSRCDDCFRVRKAGQTDPDLIRARNLARYGCTPSQYADMFERQGGLCAICASPPVTKKLAVDHDHSTGEVRGLLCSKCNTGIGQLDDDPERLRRAADYLELPCLQ